MNTNAVGTIKYQNHTKDYIWWHNALVNLFNRALVVQYLVQINQAKYKSIIGHRVVKFIL